MCGVMSRGGCAVIDGCRDVIGVGIGGGDGNAVLVSQFGWTLCFFALNVSHVD